VSEGERALRLAATWLDDAMQEAKRHHDEARQSGADAKSIAYDAGRYAGIRDALAVIDKLIADAAI
jgi:hypothetical protein